MKKFYTLLTALFCLTVTANAQKYVGGDISLLTQYESHGALYYNHSGQAISDMLTFFKQQGLNAMRLRLFVNPDNATTAEKGQGVCQNIEYVKALGKRIKDAGFKLMIDFHYSDTWADPSKQWTPKEWLSLSDEQLQEKIYSYTYESLKALKDAGAEPDFIQTGNEISYGMLWGEGIIDEANSTDTDTKYQKSSTYKSVYVGNTTGNYPANWNRFVALLKKASSACRDMCPNAKIIIHTERVPNASYMQNFYKTLKSDGVDYDIMGISYYSYYHGDFKVLKTALTTLTSIISDKKIMIVEAGYPYAWPAPETTTDLTATYPYSDEGQKAFTEALIETLNSYNNVIGLFWWWPEANEYGLDWSTNRVTNGWYNPSLFDNRTGKATSALSSLRLFLGNEDGIVAPEITNKIPDNKWYNINGQQISGKPTQKGIYINNGKKMVVR